jgi:L-rhamnose mutarotase
MIDNKCEDCCNRKYNYCLRHKNIFEEIYVCSLCIRKYNIEDYNIFRYKK